MRNQFISFRFSSLIELRECLYKIVLISLGSVAVFSCSFLILFIWVLSFFCLFEPIFVAVVYHHKEHLLQLSIDFLCFYFINFSFEYFYYFLFANGFDFGLFLLFKIPDLYYEVIYWCSFSFLNLEIQSQTFPTWNYF